MTSAIMETMLQFGEEHMCAQLWMFKSGTPVGESQSKALFRFSCHCISHTPISGLCSSTCSTN